MVGDKSPANGDGLKLQAIANRGVKVYPGGFSDTFTVDHWRCRFVVEGGGEKQFAIRFYSGSMSQVWTL